MNQKQSFPVSITYSTDETRSSSIPDSQRERITMNQKQSFPLSITYSTDETRTLSICQITAQDMSQRIF